MAARLIVSIYRDDHCFILSYDIFEKVLNHTSSSVTYLDDVILCGVCQMADFSKC